MVYAEFGGQTECIMGNWKIENVPIYDCIFGFGISSLNNSKRFFHANSQENISCSNCLIKTSEIERSSVFDWPYFLCELDFVRSFLAIEVSIEFD